MENVGAMFGFVNKNMHKTHLLYNTMLILHYCVCWTFCEQLEGVLSSMDTDEVLYYNSWCSGKTEHYN